MKLTTKEAELFFELMGSLQFFVNDRLKLIKGIRTVEEYSLLPHKEKLTVREKIYEQPELIDKYVTANPHRLDAQNLNAVKQWKLFVKGDFFLERYLKKHAIFIGDDIVYGVCALNDGFDDFFPKNYLPIYVKTVLLPFQGKIIYDGLLHSYNIVIGGGIKSSLKETYMWAKQNGEIITSLDDQGADREQAETLITKDWSAEIEQLSAIAKKLRGGSGQPAINSPVFSLIKASVALADKALANPSNVEMLFKELGKVERALDKIEDTLYRMDYWCSDNIKF